MELYLQFGYGMMDHSRALITQWGGGTVILSPRDLSSGQLISLATDLTNKPNGSVLLDPQFYLPHSDHERLCSHDYWPSDYETGGFYLGTALDTLLLKLYALNATLGTSAFILPGLFCGNVNEQWLETQQRILRAASVIATNQQLIVTIALSADAVRDATQIEQLLENASRHTAAGYYIVCEHPNGDYLVDDAIWLVNLLDLIAGLRLLGARVILGYCNQQLLIAGVVKTSAIASGTWMNVRSFPPEKFRAAYEEEIKQREIWYYAFRALSEYKITYLDIAQRNGILQEMAPSLPSPGVMPLFGGAQPTAVDFKEPAAFRHYLNELRLQVSTSVDVTFDETVANYNRLLDNASTLLAALKSAGISGQQRDFSDIVDVNRAALRLLVADRGSMLRRRWNSL